MREERERVTKHKQQALRTIDDTAANPDVPVMPPFVQSKVICPHLGCFLHTVELLH
jgi:hypothetical protein